jgi:hypothetical protein
VKTKWRLLAVAVLLPAAGAVQAAQPRNAGLQSPASFDEALRGGPVPVQLVAMEEPTPADVPVPPAPGGASSAAPSTASPAPTAGGSMTSGDCGCDSCGDCCDMGNCGCGPLWSVRAGALFLDRSDPERRNLVRGRGIGAPIGVVWGDAFDFGNAAGPDITIARWLDNGTGIEARYFGALEWDSELSFLTPPQWALNVLPQIDEVGVGMIDVEYVSTLNSTEINWRGGPNQDIGFLIGFRWVELHEELNASADFGAIMGSAGWNTDNHLYGSQIGVLTNLLRSGGPFSLNAWGKAGIYGNDADNEFNFDANIGPDINNRTEESQVAFVGDVAAIGTYWFTRSVGISGGYQLLWIDGVALASEQVNVTSSLTGQGVNTTGDVFYHGALVSLDFLW